MSINTMLIENPEAFEFWIKAAERRGQKWMFESFGEKLVLVIEELIFGE